jgi:hypothetical protein
MVTGTDVPEAEPAAGSTSEDIAEVMGEHTSMLTPEAAQADAAAAADDVRARINPPISGSTSGPERARAAAEAEARAGDSSQSSPDGENDPGLAMPEFPPPGMFGEPVDLPEERLRLAYMGGTPDKYSPTGQIVVARMRSEGLIQGVGPLLPGNPNGLQVEYQGIWYTIDDTIDMAHRSPEDAVIWWNEVGRFTGARSPTVREFMENPDNYVLMPQGPNRSAGASLDERYLPPEIDGF